MFFMNAFEIKIKLLDGNMLDDSSVFTARWQLHAVFFLNSRFSFVKHCHQSGATTEKITACQGFHGVTHSLNSTFIIIFFWGGKPMEISDSGYL